MATEHMCAGCGRTFVRYNTLNKICPLCSMNKYTKRKKPMKVMGKVAKAWVKSRNEWMDNNPEPWFCYICGRLLTVNTLTLDHIVSRGRSPSLRDEQSNLAPACWKCNEAKGSLSLEEYKAKICYTIAL